MFGLGWSATSRSVRLPNGLVVDALNSADTRMVYRDIFEDDGYRRHGITIRNGDCVFDVGANTGLFVVYLNQICSDATVYACEPVSAIFDVLRRNVARHNHLTIHLLNIGLSRQPGRANFVYYPRLSCASTMYPDDSEKKLAKVETMCWTTSARLPKSCRSSCRFGLSRLFRRLPS